MAVFTIELGRLRETGFELGLTANDYPIYDEAYRPVLNKLILDHFEFREIGQETPQLFKKFLNRKLREIMPYYNEMYKSQLIVFNPLFSQDIDSSTTTTVTRTSHANETSSGNSDQDSTGRALVSTTPQTQLSNNEDYAAGLTDTNSKGTSVTSGVSESIADDTGVTDYVYNVAGYSGQNPSDAIMRFRRSLINVNLMILSELETLFMGIWHSEIGGM